MCRVLADAVVEGRYIAAHRPAEPASQAESTGRRQRPSGRADAGLRLRAVRDPARRPSPPRGPSRRRPAPDPDPGRDRRPRTRPRPRTDARPPTAGRDHRPRTRPDPGRDHDPGRDRRAPSRPVATETTGDAVMADVHAPRTFRQLRQATGVGMLDAKRALEENDGDLEAAGQWLREQGLAGAAKRADREASQGAVAVARRDDACRDRRAAVRDRLRGQGRRVRGPRRRAGGARWPPRARRRWTAAPTRSTPCGPRSRRTSRSAGWSGSRPARARSWTPTSTSRPDGASTRSPWCSRGGTTSWPTSVAVHLAFAEADCTCAGRTCPEDEVDGSARPSRTISRNEGKPEAALPKIVEGRMNGWFKERCLLEQSYAQRREADGRRPPRDRPRSWLRPGRRRRLRS